MSLREKIINFIKKEIVLIIAMVLAVASSFLVPPDREYLGYIDIDTLIVLFCLMAIVAGIKETGAFDKLAGRMLCKVKTVRQMMFMLIILCFCFSMLITNDVALITFVPLTLALFGTQDKKIRERWIVPTVVLQTVAANLGSMLTPIGNPQNLFLYGKSGISFGKFMGIMLPYALLAFVLILAAVFVMIGKKNETLSVARSEKAEQTDCRKLLLYLLLCVPALLSVVHILDNRILLVIVFVTVMLFDRKVLAGVDYFLLLTFAAFFVFIGNMGRLPFFRDFLSGIIEGREMLTSVLTSQFISNVPAALLLSGFTSDYRALMIGTNIGGLGTLIASMASLISYKLITGENPECRGRYTRVFTMVNVAFLVIMILICTEWPAGI